MFVHLLSELQIPKSERPAEEWQGKPQEKNHHVPPHTLRNSEKVKKKTKKKEQDGRLDKKKKLLFFKTVTSSIYSLAFFFFFTALLRNPTNCIVAALNGPAPFPPLLPACTSVVSNADIIGDILECMISIRLKLTDTNSVIDKSVDFK